MHILKIQYHGHEVKGNIFLNENCIFILGFSQVGVIPNMVDIYVCYKYSKL